VTAKPVALYIATYESADGAEEDFAIVRRLRRDGVIGTAVGGVMAQSPAGWAWREASSSSSPAAGAVSELRVDELLGMLLSPSLPGAAVSSSSADADPDALPNRLDVAAREEFRETLTNAGAAVVILAEEKIAPALRVALARAHNLIQHRLSEAGMRCAIAAQTAAAPAG